MSLHFIVLFCSNNFCDDFIVKFIDQRLCFVVDFNRYYSLFCSWLLLSSNTFCEMIIFFIAFNCTEFSANLFHTAWVDFNADALWLYSNMLHYCWIAILVIERRMLSTHKRRDVLFTCLCVYVCVCVQLCSICSWFSGEQFQYRYRSESICMSSGFCSI